MKHTFKALFCFILACLLVLGTLLSVVSCKSKKSAVPVEEDEQEPATVITIAGKSIANHVVVYPHGEENNARYLRRAISNFDEELTLPITETDPQNGKVIRLRVDPQQSPAACRIYVEDRALTIAVHTATFMRKAIDVFKSVLEGDNMDFPSGYSLNEPYTPVSYQAVSGSKKLIGDADKNPLSYNVGDGAKITVAAVSDGRLLSVPLFHVEVWNEATKRGEDLYVDGSKGYVEYSVENFSKAGFLHVKVNACNADKSKLSGFADSADGGNHFVGSVGFGVAEIMPAGNAFGFDGFWSLVTEEVRGLNFDNVKLMQLENTRPGFVTYYWEAPTGGVKGDGEPNVAAGYLTVPENASATNKIGLHMTFQAYNGSIPIPDPSYRDNKATLIVCAHGFDLERAKEDGAYYQSQKDLIDGHIITQDYFRGMIKRDLMGARFLLEHFGPAGENVWDGTTFEVAGNSMGAMQSTAVAALTKDVTGTDVSLLDVGIPWLCDTRGESAGRKARSWPDNIADLVFFDPARFAPKLTCTVRIYAALGDQICPPSSVMAFYNSISGVDKRITCEQNTSHSYGVGGAEYQLSQSKN